MIQQQHHTILNFVPEGFSGGLEALQNKYLHKAGVPTVMVSKQAIPNAVPTKTGRKSVQWTEEQKQFVGELFDNAIRRTNPRVILITHPAALHHVTNHRYWSLFTSRGSLYHYRGIPCIVVNQPSAIHRMSHGAWLMLFDYRKLARFYNGTVRRDPPLNITVCHELDDVRRCLDFATVSTAISLDIETSAGMISSIAYAILNAHGGIDTFTIPLINPTKPGACHWSLADEQEVWKIIREIHQLPQVKIMQNGSYDTRFLMRDNAPLNNYILDPAVMFHSLWIEAPKRLDFITSIACDSYAYWKDEAKEEDVDKKDWAVPKTLTGLQNYWNYNGKDAHFTLLSAVFFLRVMCVPQYKYAFDNYVDTMRQVIGPATFMSMHGAKVNRKIKDAFELHNQRESATALADLRTMADCPDFNMRSPQQKKKLIYGVYRAAPIPRKGQTTNEKVLQLIQTQHPLLDVIIEQLWKAMKPANDASKYGHNMQLVNSRWYYEMQATGTTTFRYSSKKSNLGFGQQIQNPPYRIRPMVEADEGYILFRADYSKSDKWFTAHEMQESNMLNVLHGDKEVHCLHAHQFFRIPYDKIFAGFEKDETWVTDSLTGVRQIVKRIGYGADYQMTGDGLFVQMGKAATDQAAKELGKSTAGWGHKQYVQFCQALLDYYFNHIYPDLKPALYRKINETQANGNKAVCAYDGTRAFFADIGRDKSAQRQLAAFYGQAGSAKNINRALDRLFYETDFVKRDGRLLFQIHDEIDAEVPVGAFDLCETILSCMDNEVHINGKTFRVPTEAQIGIGWGKRMVPYIRGESVGDALRRIQEHEVKWWEKFNVA